MEGSSTNLAVFLAGDFNSQDNQEAYLAMKDSDLMTDLRDHVAPEKRYGDEITFIGFHKDQDPEDHGRIDFIWLGPKDAVGGDGDGDGGSPTQSRLGLQWTVQRYAVLSNVFESGVYNSDHRAVVGDVYLHR